MDLSVLAHGTIETVNPLRKLAIALTALGCAGLLGCSSSSKTPVAPALPPAAVSASASSGSTAPSAPSAPAAPSGSAAAPSTAPNASAIPTSGVAVLPPPAKTTGAQANPTGAAQPPAAQPPAAKPPAAQPTATKPGSVPLPSGGDPAKAVADAGPKGQDYLQALRAAGVPVQPGLEEIYILFAKATCDAKAKGTSRQDILSQFSQIGSMLAPGSKLSQDQIAEAFVSSAERTLC